MKVRFPFRATRGAVAVPVLAAVVALGSIALGVGAASSLFRDGTAADMAPMPPVDSTSVYGPTVFDIPSGNQAIHVENFSVPFEEGSRFRIFVHNGDPLGGSDVDSVLVRVNTVKLIEGPIAAGETKSVDVFGLEDWNLLRVVLNGPTNSEVTLEVFRLDTEGTIIFGPVELIRTAGGPQEETHVFDLPAGVSGPFGLHVNNGYADGTGRTRRARVALNGMSIFNPWDFNLQVGYLEDEVAVQDSANSLLVRLGGTVVGTRIEVWLTGVVTDTIPPTISIDSPQADLITSDDSVTVSGTVSDNISATVDVNGVSATVIGDTAYTALVPLPSDGSTLITATATDGSGNEATATVTVIRDQSAPSLTVTAPTDSLITIYPQTPLVGTAVDDNGADVTANGIPVPTDSLGAFAEDFDLADGTNIVTVTATDPAGNQAVVVRTVILDTIAPALSLTSPTDSLLTNADTAVVSGTVSDLTIVTIDANGVAIPVEGTGAFTGSVPLVSGSNTITVTATDQATNASTEVRTVIRDSDAPVLTVTAPTAAATLPGDTVAVSGTVTDASAVTVTANGVNLPVDGAGAFAGSVVLTEGVDSVSVVATDAAMNEATEVRVVTIDLTAPTLTLTAPADSLLTDDPTVVVSGTVTDATAVTVDANGTAIPVDSVGGFSGTVTAVEGSNAITVTATDAAGNASQATRTVILDSAAPVLTLTAPADSAIIGVSTVTVSGSVVDASAVTVDANGVPLPVDGAGLFSGNVALAEGANIVTVTATDAAGNFVQQARVVTVDTQAPVLVVTAPTDGSSTSADSVDVTGTVTDATATTLTLNGGAIPLDGAGAFNERIALSAGANTLAFLATDAAGNSAVDTVVVTMDDPLPPDPMVVATPVPQNVVTTIGAATSFLYEGADPIQTGVVPGTIDEVRVAVVKGRVLDTAGLPLSGVTVSVLGHPEFGQTLSRADGEYDLAVNGGGILNLRYQLAGHPDVQRRSELPWQDYTFVDDVVMTPLDTAVTVIDFTDPIEIHQGTAQTDTDGTRQATLMFRQGTTATMVMPNGTTQGLSSISVRASEYTVGTDGQEAMPADLPATSGYTYAVELSVDEAVAAGAERVEFSQAVPVYVENFIGFPVGWPVPSGYFDRTQGEWFAEPDGRVIEVVAIDSLGNAELDIDTIPGSESAATVLAELNITADELASIGATYSVGDELWRTEVAHFSPWDFNWPLFLPDYTDRSPNNPDPEPGDDDNIDDPCEVSGSIIGCENQSLIESLPVVGTPYSINYSSLRVPGRASAFQVDIPVTGDTIPTDLQRIEVTILVAGQRFIAAPPVAPMQNVTFTWNGLDAYGREVQGEQPIRAVIGYAYQGQYDRPANLFASFGSRGGGGGGGGGGGVAIVLAREEVVLTQTWDGFIGGRYVGGSDARNRALGGWSLNVHHAYDPVAGRLHLGNGQTRSAEGIGDVVESVTGTGAVDFDPLVGEGGPASEAPAGQPIDVAVRDDGAVAWVGLVHNRIRLITDDGLTNTVVGGGALAPDSVPADSASLTRPIALEYAPDGSLWIGGTTSSTDVLYRVFPDGIIDQYGGGPGFAGDGGPVSDPSVQFKRIADVAVDKDGYVYVLHGWGTSLNCLGGTCRRIRQIAPDGTITTIAGNGAEGTSGNGGPATEARFFRPRALATGPDGSIYVGDQGSIRRILPDGIIVQFAGNGSTGYTGDGGKALDALIDVNGPGIEVDDNGNVFFSQNGAVRKIDSRGIITTVLGTGDVGYSGDGGRSAAAMVRRPHGLALAPNGALYVADIDDHRVRQVGGALPGFDAGELLIPSADRAALYRFSAAGQHLETIWARTGVVLSSFAYDAENRLASITDTNGLQTTIQRAPDGSPLSITGPYGQVAPLTVDSRGYLSSLSNPAGDAFSFEADSIGLIQRFITPTSDTTSVAYDSLGLVVEHTDPVGRVRSWSRSEGIDSTLVELTTPAGVTTYRTVLDSTGTVTRTVTGPTGFVSTTVADRAGNRTLVTPDSSVVMALTFPEGRPLDVGIPGDSLVTTTPGGLTNHRSMRRTVSTADSLGTRVITSIADTVRVNGRLSTSVWTRASNESVLRSATGRETTTTFDAFGRTTAIAVPGVDTVVMARDSLSRLTTVSQGDRTWTYRFDVLGRLDESTDPVGRTVRLNYDAANRVTELVRPDSTTVAYAHDAAGRLDSITTPDGQPFAYRYARDGQITAFEPPDSTTLGGVIRVDYDSVGRPERVGVSGGRSVAFSYDASGRLQATPSSSDTIVYGYDLVTGSLDQITSGAEELLYTSDGDLVTSVTSLGSVPGSVEFGYDSDYRLSMESVNGADTVAYAYDDDGLMTVTGQGTIGRDAVTGIQTSYGLGSLTTVFSHNDFGEVASEGTSIPGFGTIGFDYQRDSLGRVVAQTSEIGADTLVWAYEYDLIGRLVDVDLNGVPYATYGYDDDGNRTMVTDGGGSRAMVVNSQDQAVSFGASAYQYDLAGFLTSKVSGSDTTLFSYDDLGNLRSVVTPAGSVIEYSVDPLQRRIQTRVDGQVTQRLLYRDGINPVAEIDSAGGVVTRFVYGAKGTVPDYMERGGSVYRILSDQRGSVRAVVEVATDSVVQRIDYGPWGEVLLDTNPGFQPFGFAGGLHAAETGLVRFGARDYDPELGRWTAKDPLGFDGGDLNLYAYALNDPVNRVDPTGQFVTDLLDVVSFYFSLRDFLRCPSLKNGLFLAFDTFALLPGMPGRGILALGAVGSDLARTADRASDAARATERARDVGRAGEAAAGIEKNTDRIPSLSGTAAYRVPDGLTDDVLSEVKNVAKQSYTQQLRDFADFAQATGRRFDLIVRRGPNGTRLSGPLQQAVDEGRINLIRRLPPP